MPRELEQCRSKVAGRGSSCQEEGKKGPVSRGWFRSIDLWVMGPARFRCATLLPPAPLLAPPTALPDAPWHCQPSCLFPFLCPVPSRGPENGLSGKFTSLGPGGAAQGPCLALLPTSPAHNPAWGLSSWSPKLALQALEETPERGGSLVALQGRRELLSSELRRAATLPRKPTPRGLWDCARCQHPFFASRGGRQGRLALPSVELPRELILLIWLSM